MQIYSRNVPDLYKPSLFINQRVLNPHQEVMRSDKYIACITVH